MGTINVTTLEGKIDAITDLNLDLIALQETSLTGPQQRQMKKQLGERGWEATFGLECKLLTDGQKTWTAAGGVAILTRTGTPVRRIKHERLDNTGRFVHAGVSYGNGKVLHVFSFYGDVRSAVHTEELIAEMLVEAAALGDVPVLIAGDFNVETTESPALLSAFAHGLWIDAAVSMGNMTPTSEAGKGLRRIDAILMNRGAATAISNDTTIHVHKSELIPTHKPVIIRKLNISRYNEKAPRLIVPKQLDTSETTDPREGKAERQLHWTRAVATEDPDKMLEALGEIIERYLLTGKLEVSNPAKYTGRGKKREPVMWTNAAKQDGRGATCRETRRRLQKIRVLEEVTKITKQYDGPTVPSHEVMNLWKKLRKLDPTTGSEIPQTEELRILLQQARQEQAIESKKLRTERIRMWKRNVVDNWNDDRTKVFQWIRNVEQSKTVLMEKADGSWTANCSEMDEAMHAAWDPILKKYLSDPEPDWMKFEERYSNYIEEHPMRCEDITGGDVAKALRRTSSRKAAGVDGFRISELKLLPEDMIQMIAEFYNMVERTHWPEALLTALVSAIPKGAGTKPLEQRPITVTSALYRLWGCIRMEKDVMEWQEKWAHDGQYGYRKGRSTLDLSWKIALDVEHATLYGEEVAGVTTDFRKCFDLIPHDILLKLVKELGLSDKILRTVTDVYRRLRRRFKFPSGVGEEFATTNGILQGCPLSVVLFNALSSILSKAIEREADVTPGSYADDLTLFGSRTKLQEGVEVVAEFCTLTGQELAPQKCKWFSNRDQGQTNITMGDTTLDFDDSVDIVGCHLSMKGTTKQMGRITEEVLDRARRIRLLPLRYQAKEQIAAASVMPKALFGTALYDPDTTRLGLLRRAMATGIFRKLGGKRTKMSHTMGLTLLCKGHCVDPATYIRYNRLLALTRMLPKLTERIRRVWEHLQEHTEATRGPVGLALSTLKELGWEWSTFSVFEGPGGTTEHGRLDAGRWRHDVREACRRFTWNKTIAETRRVNLRGIEAGIDRKETLKVLKEGKGDPYLRGVVKHCLLDNVYTGSMKAGNKNCAHCEEVDDVERTETLEHVNWDCRAYDTIRQEYPQVMLQVRCDWPNCLRLLGIKPDNVELPAGLTGDLQRMFARIRLRRDDYQQLEERRLMVVEYAGNKEPEVVMRYNNKLEKYMPVYTQWPEALGLTLYLALASYLRELKWPRQPDGVGVTFLELAIDFEAYAGVDIPTTVHEGHVAKCTKDRAAGKKADVMCGLMLRLNLVHKHLEGEEQRTFPDYCVGSNKALRPLGAPVLKGLKKRPAFLMGDETVDTIRRTVQEANDGKADKIRFGFETECRHSNEREGRAEEWITAARLFPSKEKDVQLRRELCERGPTRPPPEVVKRPGIAEGQGTMNSTCYGHFKKKCNSCRRAGNTIYQCCHNHHTLGDEDGQIPIWDFCSKHKLTPCAVCIVIGRGSEQCCRNSHHRCCHHEMAPCNDCKRNPDPEQRTATKCCNKKHHGPIIRTLTRRAKQPTKHDMQTSTSLLKVGFTKQMKPKAEETPEREPQDRGLT